MASEKNFFLLFQIHRSIGYAVYALYLQCWTRFFYKKIFYAIRMIVCIGVFAKEGTKGEREI